MHPATQTFRVSPGGRFQSFLEPAQGDGKESVQTAPHTRLSHWEAQQIG